MGLLNKLQFWKHDDEFASPSESAPSYDLGAPSDPLQQSDPMQGNPSFSDPAFNPQPFAQQNYPQSTPFPGRPPPQAAFQPVQEQHEAPAIHPRDVELILAKLDAIKSEMDALHQRVRKIEQATESGKKYW